MSARIRRVLAIKANKGANGETVVAERSDCSAGDYYVTFPSIIGARNVIYARHTRTVDVYRRIQRLINNSTIQCVTQSRSRRRN